ncbi:MAG TPA: amidohydrolase family protein [Steroidobacteraceae bacterium]|jgi:predicted TIM-barrel fold metal-dependent hydrolase|nr:amidohydrolase family protein [Steroidobacteraceae bacterium]
MLTRRRWLASAFAMATIPGAAWARRRGSGLSFPLFDAHAHLESGDLVHYPRAPSPPPLPGPPPPQPTGELPEVVRVLRWMDQNGVAGGAAMQRRGAYGLDNRYLLDSTDQYRERLVPVVVLDAEDPNTPGTVRELIDRHGIAGVRLSGTRGSDGGFSWLESPAAQRTWAAVNAAGLVMDLMTLPPGSSAPAMAAYARLARQYPQARLVLDHCAWPDAAGPPDFGLGADHRALLAHRNIYFKFTTVNLETLHAARASASDALRHFVAVLGASRLMWGSDIGNSAGLYGEMVSRIVAASSGLSRRDRRQVLHDTGQTVMVAGGRRS